jgi:hypothetical protein
LQCVLAAKILTVYFVVCTLAVKKKSGQVSTCRIGPFPCEFIICTKKKKKTCQWLKNVEVKRLMDILLFYYVLNFQVHISKHDFARLE